MAGDKAGEWKTWYERNIPIAEQRFTEQDAYVAGYRLSELRIKTGITQVQLARIMGVSQARISAMERGDVQSLTIASVRTYIAALGGVVRVVASVDDVDVTLRLPESAPEFAGAGCG